MENNLYTTRQYLQNNPTWHAEDSPWKASEIYKMMLKHSLNINNMCEVGCGAGEILYQLSLLMQRERERERERPPLPGMIYLLMQ